MNYELQSIINAENENEINRLYKENERLKAENNKLRNDYYTIVDRLADVEEAYNRLRRNNANISS